MENNDNINNDNKSNNTNGIKIDYDYTKDLINIKEEVLLNKKTKFNIDENDSYNLVDQKENVFKYKSIDNNNNYNDNELSLDNLDKKLIETEEKQKLMVFNDFYEINYENYHNFHKKLVIHNLPENVSDDECKQYFYTFLTTLNAENTKINPILSIEHYKNENFWIIEINNQENMDILLNIDHTEWRGYRIRIERLPVFFRKYNSSKGENVKHKKIIKELKSGNLIDYENRLFLSGFPLNATKNDIQKVLESFGDIKYLDLVEDYHNPGMNKGFAFFEFVSSGVIPKAMEMINNLTFGESKLKVKKSSNSHKEVSEVTKIKEEYKNFVESNNINDKQAKDFSFLIDEEIKNNYYKTLVVDEKIEDKQNANTKYEIDVPMPYCVVPSRVIVLTNILEPEDLIIDSEYKEIIEDIRSEVTKFGLILNLEIPRPYKDSSLVLCEKFNLGKSNHGVGKVFIKFYTLTQAKIARFRLAGKKFNNRTTVAYFYPENMFDIRDFITNEEPNLSMDFNFS